MPVIADKENVLSNIIRLIKVCHLTEIPIVVTEQEKLGNTVAEIKNEFSTETAIQKIHFNCFESEAFAARVKETGRTTLIIAGIEAHICVAQTALAGHPRFRIHVVGDAAASRSPDNVLVALDRMRASGITITSTEMVIYELLRKAGTAEFKAMLPLVK